MRRYYYHPNVALAVWGFAAKPGGCNSVFQSPDCGSNVGGPPESVGQQPPPNALAWLTALVDAATLCETISLNDAVFIELQNGIS